MDWKGIFNISVVLEYKHTICIVDSLSFFIFIAFTYKTSIIVHMFEIFHLQSNAGLKASLAIIDITTFILRSSNLEWQEKEPIIRGGVYFQHKWNLSLSHTYTYISIPFLKTGNRSVYSFISVMKKKMWTNVITRWLERWFSQRQVENNDNTILNVFSIRRLNRTPQEE